MTSKVLADSIQLVWPLSVNAPTIGPARYLYSTPPVEILISTAVPAHASHISFFAATEGDGSEAETR